MTDKYVGLIVLGVIFSFLIWLYVTIYCYSIRYTKKLKRLKKLKLLSKRIRRGRVR